MEKIRIALAEDHNIVRKGLVAMLNRFKEIEVVGDASNGKELMQVIAYLKQPPDVCLLDITMPEMDGYATLVALKKAYPQMKFLMLTQLEHEFVIIKMLKAGANGYLLKDDEPRELKKAILAVVKQQFYHNKLVSGQLISMVQKGRPYKKLSLSAKEQTFLALCCSELAYKEIGGQMDLTDDGVNYYRKLLFDKLGVVSRTGLALYALKLGLVPVEG